MLNAIDKTLLKSVADLEGIPKGAYNIRKNGQLLGREVSGDINIEFKLSSGQRYTTQLSITAVNDAPTATNASVPCAFSTNSV